MSYFHFVVDLYILVNEPIFNFDFYLINPQIKKHSKIQIVIAIWWTRMDKLQIICSFRERGGTNSFFTLT